jgi:D-alanyl-D-alanine carboxypeptidase/D-alanyl-D-alanine-endopeptidase (penicillin-binding protein 4)
MKGKAEKLLLVAALFGICLVGVASADLGEHVDGIISRPSQRKVQFSIHIVKADSGKTVYSHNACEALVPASNMKITTTAAALKYLGPNFEYKTRAGLCGDTLVIIGSGDPLLGDKVTDAKYGRKDSWVFEDITSALKQNGITTVKDIVVDNSIFDGQRVHPNWPKEQLNRWYACEVSGLNYNGNCVDVATKNLGGKVIVSIEPKTDFVRIINKVRPISKGTGAVGAYRSLEPNVIILKGKCRNKQGPFSVAIERPAAFFGYLLAENLRKAGIKTKGQLIEKAVEKNCRLRVLRERGGMIISEYLASLGVGQSEFHIDDASGLSRQNKLSANAVTTVLSAVYKSEDWELYKDSLSVGGVDGTIRKYFKEEKYKGRVFGKTGYISSVKSLSGICTAAGGDYIFSVLTNRANGKTRATINDIAKAIIDDG